MPTDSPNAETASLVRVSWQNPEPPIKLNRASGLIVLPKLLMIELPHVKMTTKVRC